MCDQARVTHNKSFTRAPQIWCFPKFPLSPSVLRFSEIGVQVSIFLGIFGWSSLHMIWWIFVSNIMSIGVDLNCFWDLGFELLAFCTLQWFSAATTSQSFWQQLLFFVWVQCCESNKWVAGYMFSTDFGSSIQHAGRARLAGCLLAIQ